MSFWCFWYGLFSRPWFSTFQQPLIEESPRSFSYWWREAQPFSFGPQTSCAPLPSACLQLSRETCIYWPHRRFTSLNCGQPVWVFPAYCLLHSRTSCSEPRTLSILSLVQLSCSQKKQHFLWVTREQFCFSRDDEHSSLSCLTHHSNPPDCLYSDIPISVSVFCTAVDAFF